MSTIHRTAPDVQVRRHVPADSAAATEPLDAPRFGPLRAVAGILRIGLGWIFLWAFLDKMFALGFSTGRDAETGVVDRFGDAAWLNGGSPTKGFLSFGTKGPLADFYGSFAGAAWADWLFMIGLLGIGLALVLGIGTRIAAVGGSLMLLMMWSAVLAPENNPFMDDHIVYALTLIVLALMGAGRFIGLGRQWEQLTVVKKHGWLK
jgi:thiosulfate dehydrogenase [quinone] large subunit